MFNHSHARQELSTAFRGPILLCLRGATPGSGSGLGPGGSHHSRFNWNHARISARGSILAGLTGATPYGSSGLSPGGLILPGLTGATPYGSLVLSPGGPILPGLTGADRKSVV